MATLEDTLELEGRAWIPGALSEAELEILDRICATGNAPGVRLEWTREIAAALAPVESGLRSVLPDTRPVRIVAFDKSEKMNWGLPWHQDRVVALRDRVETSGFGNWTRKSGVWHAEPPIGVLEQTVFARVHLDRATTKNGCLELALGSHQQGRISEQDISAVIDSSLIELCEADRGDVLIARALLLHRSRPSREPANRRALRIDYSAARLPPPLEWAIVS